MTTAVKVNAEVSSELEHNKDEMKLAEEQIDSEILPAPTKEANGKLILAEEIAEGNVGWSSRRFRVPSYVVCVDVYTSEVPVCRHGRIQRPRFLDFRSWGVRTDAVGDSSGKLSTITLILLLITCATANMVSWCVDLVDASCICSSFSRLLVLAIRELAGRPGAGCLVS